MQHKIPINTINPIPSPSSIETGQDEKVEKLIPKMTTISKADLATTPIVITGIIRDEFEFDQPSTDGPCFVVKNLRIARLPNDPIKIMRVAKIHSITDPNKNDPL